MGGEVGRGREGGTCPARACSFIGICALATGQDDATLRTAFRALDANGDRTLDFEEIIAFVR